MLSQATLLPADTDATALIDTLLAQPRAYQQANDHVETELVIYLAGRVCEPILSSRWPARRPSTGRIDGGVNRD